MLTRIGLILILLFTSIAPSGRQILTQSFLDADQDGLSADDFEVVFYPAAPYHVGDILSVELMYSGNEDLSNLEVSLAMADQPHTVLASTKFSPHRPQAILYWAIDTTQMKPGSHLVQFQIPALNTSWETNLNLLPEPENRPYEWASIEMDCCVIHFITGTDAAEDIDLIRTVLKEETAKVIAQFFPDGVPEAVDPFQDPLNLVLVPAVVGHGGFATDEAVMTYAHDNWAGTEIAILAHHEIVHVVDRLLNDGQRPSLLAEGLAVYLSGGHYRQAPLLESAAALIDLDAYIPLTSMVNDFYAAQHEASYLEAGALVAYMVARWGWEAYIDFYFNLTGEDMTDYELISAGLKAQFDIDFETLEANFITFLDQHPAGQAVTHNVRLTIAIYDTIRRYQRMAVPTAYFRSAWWPNLRRMREAGIVGDYLPPEKGPFNVIVEGMLLDIHASLDAGAFQDAEADLNALNQILDQVEESGSPPSHYQLGWPLPDIFPILRKP